MGRKEETERGDTECRNAIKNGVGPCTYPEEGEGFL
jgi:hypothetical protein